MLAQWVRFVFVVQIARTTQDEVNLFTALIDLGVATTFWTKRDLSKPRDVLQSTILRVAFPENRSVTAGRS